MSKDDKRVMHMQADKPGAVMDGSTNDRSPQLHALNTLLLSPEAWCQLAPVLTQFV